MKKLAGILAVICGNVLLAFGIAAFLEPTGIISGGTTGIGLFDLHRRRMINLHASNAPFSFI